MWKEKELDNLPRKDEKGPLSVRDRLKISHNCAKNTSDVPETAIFFTRVTLHSSATSAMSPKFNPAVLSGGV